MLGGVRGRCSEPLVRHVAPLSDLENGTPSGHMTPKKVLLPLDGCRPVPRQLAGHPERWLDSSSYVTPQVGTTHPAIQGGPACAKAFVGQCMAAQEQTVGWDWEPGKRREHLSLSLERLEEVRGTDLGQKASSG